MSYVRVDAQILYINFFKICSSNSITFDNFDNYNKKQTYEFDVQFAIAFEKCDFENLTIFHKTKKIKSISFYWKFVDAFEISICQ